MFPAIVVTAYNRPQALARLLASLESAWYPQDREVILHISIDRSEDGYAQKVCEVAENFYWKFGKKIIVYQENHLGLLQHFYSCGNLAVTYGAIILLEDDLLTSPMFYAYAAQALEYYAADDRIAGISLYALWFNGYTHHPFIPLADESDVFFLQIPYTQGQAFSKSQWQRFTSWLAAGDRRVQPGDPIHEMFLHFDEQDWFPIRTKHLIETDGYYVFPRESLATGFGDAGTHFSQTSAFFQVPLQRFKQSFRLKKLAESLAVYDSFFEILPSRLNQLTNVLHDYNYTVDLNGTKSIHNQRAEYVLTSRPRKDYLFSFGKSMWPLEANVIEAVPGEEIAFCKREDLQWGWLADLMVKKSNFDFFTRHHPVGKKLQLQFFVLSLWQKLKQKLPRL